MKKARRREKSRMTEGEKARMTEGNEAEDDRRRKNQRKTLDPLLDWIPD